MNETRALILCNNPIAVPGIREFLFYGKVAAVATTRRNKEMQHILSALVKDTGVPLLLLDRKTYKEQLAEAITANQVNIGLLMTFPYIIPVEILQQPAKGFINFHYGLLPQCRGPQPILRHLLNNDAEAGVTLHIVDAGIDTGPVVLQERIAIEADDTYGTLQNKLAYLAAKAAAQLLKIVSYGTMIPAVAQDESKAAYYEMPTAAELTIRWEQMTAAEIIRLINTCNPWNKGAGTMLNDWVLGITAASIVGEATDETVVPGTIIAANSDRGLIVQTLDKKLLQLDIIYTNEGFFTGQRFIAFGISAGMRFS